MTIMCLVSPTSDRRIAAMSNESRLNTQAWLHFRRKRRMDWLAATVVLMGLCAVILRAQPQHSWFKGNLHTHSLWSDGDEFPEMVTDWYKTNGYHFLAISDHNALHEGNWWSPITTAQATNVYAKYLRRFGSPWVESGMVRTQFAARLKPLNEYRALFEEPNRFLLIQSEEITASVGAGKIPVHMNATNLRDLIQPPKETNVFEVMQKTVDAVLAQRQSTGQPMFPHVNHPNYGWAITAEELSQLKGERFFEVYNGHPHVNNFGNGLHVSTERMWDIILTQRLSQDPTNVVYGLAVDDAHHYQGFSRTNSNPGRGWIMVRAPRLTVGSVIAALEQGDFYATTGVRLREIDAEKNRLAITIEPEAGVRYRTQFIGTRKGFDPASRPALGTNGLPVAT